MVPTGSWVAMIEAEREREQVPRAPDKSMRHPLCETRRRLAFHVGNSLVNLGTRFKQYGLSQPLRPSHEVSR